MSEMCSSVGLNVTLSSIFLTMNETKWERGVSLKLSFLVCRVIRNYIPCKLYNISVESLTHAGCLSQVGHQCHSQRSSSFEKRVAAQVIVSIDYSHFGIISAMAMAIQLK